MIASHPRAGRMDVQDALLLAIADEPTSDTHWLVLADWLDDAGQPGRAELVRLSLRLRRGPDSPDEARLRQLLDDGVRPCVPTLRLDVAPGVPLELAFVPPGRFVRGSEFAEKGRDLTEGPAHAVRVGRPFWISTTPLTQRQWVAVMGHDPSRFRGPDRPVENVSWLDALDFCAKASRHTGRRFRLPTEAEWEYACRAGTTGEYHGGDGLDALRRVGWCNYQAQWYSATETRPVGGLTPNAFGLYDMHGNVWEWCADWFGPYAEGEAADPQGPPSGPGRVVRGGTWYFAPRVCRSAARFYYPADLRTDKHGCRVVVDAG